MSTIIIKRDKKRFLDVDLSFKKHPMTNDILKRTNAVAIIHSIKSLIMTRMYDRGFHPEISSQIHSLLFEPMTQTIADILKRTIKYVIENFEPRVELLYVDVLDYPNESKIEIFIEFKIIGTIETIRTSFFLERTI